MKPLHLSPFLKVERAKKHIAELEVEVAKFKASKPYEIGTLRKPQTPQILYYYIVEARDVPENIPLICGDIFQNLRSSLDHLATQLVITARNTPDRDTAFPIFDTAAKYVAGAKAKIKLMRQDAIDALNAVEPYEGGRGEALWRLHGLNNIDKHKVVFTAGSIVGAIDAFSHWARQIPQIKPLADAGYCFIPTGKSFPLQQGSILFETLDTEVDNNLKFAFDVAFGEPGICYGEPILETVKGFFYVVDNLLGDFAPLL
jgi:hypothetical protein